jgi:hypothetical protein
MPTATEVAGLQGDRPDAVVLTNQRTTFVFDGLDLALQRERWPLFGREPAHVMPGA